ncbi:hypothetical protein [Pseudomonas sp. C11]
MACGRAGRLYALLGAARGRA